MNEQIKTVYSLFKPVADQKQIRLSYRTTLPEKKAIVNTDMEKLLAVLSNLVKNALKYTQKGSIEIGYQLKDKYLELYVRDTGPGIPVDRHEAIFDRFVQSDIANKGAKQGVGLGLSIAKAYVEMLGGSIWLKSEPGKGSVFFFTIPYQY
jgi:signal transduction histidine kinase